MADASGDAAAPPLRVIVVGGSLGGLLAGNLLHRAGCDVTVHERIGTELAERGVGIATHPELHAAFERLGLPIDDGFGVRLEERVAIGADGGVLASWRLPQIQATWGHLYRSLRGIFPAERHVAGSTFTRVERRGGGVRVHFAESAPIEADLLVGADGVRSAVRAQLWPDAVPAYAGYVAWRGIVEEDRLSAETRDVLFARFVIHLPPGEHVVGYPVAGADGALGPGRRRFNFVWYRAATPERLRQMQTDASGRYHEAGIAPDLIVPALVDQTRREAGSACRRRWRRRCCAHAGSSSRPSSTWRCRRWWRVRWRCWAMRGPWCGRTRAWASSRRPAMRSCSPTSSPPIPATSPMRFPATTRRAPATAGPWCATAAGWARRSRFRGAAPGRSSWARTCAGPRP